MKTGRESCQIWAEHIAVREVSGESKRGSGGAIIGLSREKSYIENREETLRIECLPSDVAGRDERARRRSI